MAFVHLQTHSEFSILQASARLDDIFAAAAADNAPAVALTDHGTMFGILEFQERGKGVNKKRKEKGLPPIKTVLGCHVYVDTQGASQKDTTTFESAAHRELSLRGIPALGRDSVCPAEYCA